MFINNRINRAKDQKEMWREIKNLRLKRDQTAIESVIFDQIECKENLQIAGKFNKFFLLKVLYLQQTRHQMCNIPITYLG